MDALDQLDPQQRAVLTLLVRTRRPYAELARPLQTDPAAVRLRAHEAVDTLLPTVHPLLAQPFRAQLVDHVLGQLTDEEDAAVAAEINGHLPREIWTTLLAETLAPLSEPPPAARRLAVTGGAAAAPPAIPEAPAPAPPPPAPRGATFLGRPVWPLLLGTVVLAAAIIGGAIIVADHRGTSSPSGNLLLPTTITTGSGTQSGDTMVLAPTAGGTASGGATIIPQGSSDVLVIHGQGLAANAGNAYAVWLTAPAAGIDHLLGFISPPVTSSGRFASGVVLPSDASQFSDLEVTAETSPDPTVPGTVVLSGPFRA
jgi:hypothetical protein